MMSFMCQTDDVIMILHGSNADVPSKLELRRNKVLVGSRKMYSFGFLAITRAFCVHVCLHANNVGVHL